MASKGVHDYKIKAASAVKRRLDLLCKNNEVEIANSSQRRIYNWCSVCRMAWFKK